MKQEYKTLLVMKGSLTKSDTQMIQSILEKRILYQEQPYLHLKVTNESGKSLENLTGVSITVRQIGVGSKLLKKRQSCKSSKLRVLSRLVKLNSCVENESCSGWIV